jgi:hypothetical protein
MVVPFPLPARKTQYNLSNSLLIYQIYYMSVIKMSCIYILGQEPGIGPTHSLCIVPFIQRHGFHPDKLDTLPVCTWNL